MTNGYAVFGEPLQPWEAALHRKLGCTVPGGGAVAAVETHVAAVVGQGQGDVGQGVAAEVLVGHDDDIQASLRA